MPEELAEGDTLTIPRERYNSIRYTRDFLYALLDPKETPKVPLRIRQMARNCLRHYPHEFQMEEVAKKLPKDWGR